MLEAAVGYRLSGETANGVDTNTLIFYACVEIIYLEMAGKDSSAMLIPRVCEVGCGAVKNLRTWRVAVR